MNQLVHWVLTVRASSCQGLVWIWFPTLNYFQQSLQTPLPQVARGVVKHVGVMNGIRPCTEMPRDAEPHAFSRAGGFAARVFGIANLEAIGIQESENPVYLLQACTSYLLAICPRISGRHIQASNRFDIMVQLVNCCPPPWCVIR